LGIDQWKKQIKKSSRKISNRSTLFSVKRKNKNHSIVKKLLFLMLIVSPMLVHAQESGLGIRLGEPLSITYKHFLDDRISIEGMFGRAGANSVNYYQRSFDNRRPNPNAFYAGHAISSPLSVQVRMAIHEDITDFLDISQGYLLGYAGVGAQIRSVNVSYNYTVPVSTGTAIFRDSRKNIDFGPEIFTGMEYYFDELPINIFTEVGLFMELIDRFAHLRIQGGIGIRYIF
jgi:hypothetical protein